jgi:hypothetical protein
MNTEQIKEVVRRFNIEVIQEGKRGAGGGPYGWDIWGEW